VPYTRLAKTAAITGQSQVCQGIQSATNGLRSISQMIVLVTNESEDDRSSGRCHLYGAIMGQSSLIWTATPAAMEIPLLVVPS